MFFAVKSQSPLGRLKHPPRQNVKANYRIRLYIGGIWIRQPQELHMKNVLDMPPPLRFTSDSAEP